MASCEGQEAIDNRGDVLGNEAGQVSGNAIKASEEFGFDIGYH